MPAGSIRVFLALLVCVAWGGCLESSVVTCADGRLCPAHLACDDAHESCVPPQQLEVCKGRAPAASCSTARIAEGLCYQGVCLPVGCGNGELDLGEACDDGNREKGDGCSADCASNELCGNGIHDVPVGEACDYAMR